MNFRNKDLNQVFNERYQANHNKELEEAARNNKKSLIERMAGKNNNNINQPSNINNRQNNPVGYTPNNNWKV